MRISGTEPSSVILMINNIKKDLYKINVRDFCKNGHDNIKFFEVTNMAYILCTISLAPPRLINNKLCEVNN